MVCRVFACVCARSLLILCQSFPPEYCPEGNTIAGMADAMQEEGAFKGYLQSLVNHIAKKRPSITSADAITQYFHHFQEMVEALRKVTVESSIFHAMRDDYIKLVTEIENLWQKLGRPQPSNRGKKYDLGRYAHAED